MDTNPINLSLRSDIEDFYRKHYRAVVYITNNIIDNKAAAEDIASNCFEKIMTRKSQINTVRDAKAFIYVSAKNEALDWLRRQQRLHKAESEISNFITGSASNDYLQILEDEVFKGKMLQAIYEEVENLTPGQRRIFKAYYIDGQNTQQIAALSGISAQTVLNQKAKMLTRLRVVLKKYSLLLILYLILVTLYLQIKRFQCLPPSTIVKVD